MHLFKNIVIATLSIVLFAGCAKKISTTSEALSHAEELYTTLSKRYEKVLTFQSLNEECIKELRILGVKIPYSWSESLALRPDKKFPIWRMWLIIKDDKEEAEKELRILSRFNNSLHPLYAKIKNLISKFEYIIEYLPTHKDYIQDNREWRSTFKI